MSGPATADASPRSLTARPRAVLLVGLLMLLLASGALLLWWQAERAQRELQRQTVLRAEQRAQQLSSVVAAQVRALVGSLDITLQQLRREWRGDPAAFDQVAKDVLAA